MSECNVSVSSDQGRSRTKTEIAELLGVPADKIGMWADKFADWLDIDSRWKHKIHDEDDFQIFTQISKLDVQIDESVDPKERIHRIERGLRSSRAAVPIRLKRKEERARPEVARWQVVSSLGVSLARDFEWLKSLKSLVHNIAAFGCWATETSPCSEPYALLWTLEATRVMVIDNNPEHIHNAQEWLEAYRKKYAYFKKYNLEFVVGDVTGKIGGLNEGEFDLSYCKNVLYIIHKEKGLEGTQNAIDEMTRVVRPGGWVIAVERKIGAKFEDVATNLFGANSLPRQVSEPIDISQRFEMAGLVRDSVDGTPKWSYCYRKPFD